MAAVPGRPALAVAAILGLAIGLARWFAAEEPAVERSPPAAPVPATSEDHRPPRSIAGAGAFATLYSDADYVGDRACASCHEEIAASYRDHPMGRSLAPIGDAPQVPRPSGATFEADGLEYAVSWRDGTLIHSEIRRDREGEVIRREDVPIRFALGSGTRGISFLHVRGGGTLHMSPISWYAQERRWDLSPGYRRENEHFDRPINPGCLDCHSGRYRARDGAVSNRYEEPIFLDHAIGCERCHGPGSLHVEAPGGAGDDGGPLIVDPGDLAPDLRESVCQRCHLRERDRIVRPGRSLEDYRPGLSMDEFVIIFIGDASSGGPLENRSVGHYGQMFMSECYQESGGRLGCTSCHDPHRAPGPAERVAFYRARCLGCHLDPSACALPEGDRLAGSAEGDCTACHMPRVPISDIAHTASTLHWVPRFAPRSRPSGGRDDPR